MDAKILLQGIAFDSKSSYLKGAAKAPPEIRKAYHSDASNYFAEDGYEIGPGIFLDSGDLLAGSHVEIEEATTALLSKELPLISLGGDHSITFPLIKAFHRKFGPVDILHIDAHPDLYDQYEGDPYSHACPFARILENGLASRLVQTGIRTATTEQKKNAEKWGVQVIPMNQWAVEGIPQFQNPLYLSLDLDALDPAFAPGVSHPEPGGFSTRELLQMLQGIRVPILGADLVEYNPDRDVNGLTARLSAKLLKEIAALILRNKPR